MKMPVRIVVFAKAPLPGQAKTRLIPALGAAGAASLARRMLEHTLAQTQAVAGSVQVELCVTPAPNDAAWSGISFPEGIRLETQGDGDLGERLSRAAARAFSQGVRPIFIGTDCPELDSARLAFAVKQLDENDVYLHGTEDGGYALLALAKPVPGIFTNIAWSSSLVFGQTVDRVRAAGVSLGSGETLHDIDTPNDLRHLPPEWLKKNA